MKHTLTDAYLQRTGNRVFAPPPLQVPSPVSHFPNNLLRIHEIAPQSSSSVDVLLPVLLERAQRDWKKYPARGPRPVPESGWAEVASRELGQLDAEADDVGWPHPRPVAVAYASAFIQSLSGIANLPLPSVTPEEDGSVSIQIGRKDFIFVLTCCEDKTGLFNVSHEEYALQGHYRNIEVEKIPNSQFFRQIACLLRTATHG